MSHQKIAGIGHPPAWSPGPQRDHYLPEPMYFGLGADRSPERIAALEEFHQRAARVTARVATHWADRYEAHPRGAARHIPPSERRREGPLPASLEEREALIDGLFDWFDQFSVDLYMAVLNLYRGNQPILHQSDGIPGVLALTVEEFAELQRVWEQQGLPRNLYYAASDQRTVIEPMEKHGGIVRTYRYFSPLQWEQRALAGIGPLLVPGEEERLETFIAACKRFADALLLRMAELSEPGQEPEGERIRQLSALYQEVNLAANRAREALLPDGAEQSD